MNLKQTNSLKSELLNSEGSWESNNKLRSTIPSGGVQILCVLNAGFIVKHLLDFIYCSGNRY